MMFRSVLLCQNKTLICSWTLLAEVPHAHGVASGGVQEGAGGVQGDLVDLTLPRWDGQTPDRRANVP